MEYCAVTKKEEADTCYPLYGPISDIIRWKIQSIDSIHDILAIVGVKTHIYMQICCVFGSHVKNANKVVFYEGTG